MPHLGVNVDHIATLRQARGGFEPDPVRSARLAEKAGAEGITVHLREDRRHIQDEDVRRLKRGINTRLNLEMSLNEDIIRAALSVRPDECCIVPERRRELTTEGGLDVEQFQSRLLKAILRLKKRGIVVSLFVDPKPGALWASRRVGADFVELHTGSYANAKTAGKRRWELRKLVEAARLTRDLGLGLNAGHGLNYENVRPVAKIPGMHTLNIGHSIVARAAYVGISKAVSEMKRLIS